MDADLHGIYVDSEDFDTCLRYCHENCVIVERIPKKCGFRVSVEWTVDYGDGWRYDKRSGRLDMGKLHIRWRPEWWHVNGKIVYVK